jgi:acyl-CoA dehydrogenase
LKLYTIPIVEYSFMPDFLPPDINHQIQVATDLINNHLKPLEKDIRDEIITEKEAVSRIRAASKDCGIYYKTQPKEFGGHPVSTLELTALRELFSSTNLALSNQVFGSGPGVLANVSGPLASQYLHPVLKGEKRAAFAFTEPGDALEPTWAIRDKDDLLVTGQKSYVTGGDSADFMAVFLNVKADESHDKGTAMVIIDKNLDGVTTEKDFSSLDGSNHQSIAFDKVRVPISNVVGKVGEGLPRALGNIGNVRLLVAAQASGIMMWTLDYVEAHLMKPHRSGTSLGMKEGVRLRLADMRIDAYATRSMLYRTARLTDAGENIVNETIATKVFATEAAGRVIDNAVQLVGGQALVRGHPLEKMYRQIRSYRLIEGASDLLRLNLVKGKLELDKGRI